MKINKKASLSVDHLVVLYKIKKWWKNKTYLSMCNAQLKNMNNNIYQIKLDK